MLKAHFQTDELKSTPVLDFTALGRVIATSHVGLRIFERSMQYMSLRSLSNRVTVGAALFASITAVCYAQIKTSARTNSASHVAAEMTTGKLNPAESKPGDAFTIRLKEDVRSNGEVILKQGTIITGIVRSVIRADGKGDWKSEAQSIIDIEWRVPAPQGRGIQGVSFALRSVLQNETSEGQQKTSQDQFDDLAFVSIKNSSPDARPVVNGRSNIALLSMPSVVAADEQTTVSIEAALGTETSEQLFRVGHGQLVSAAGSKESVELYSHLSNDTVITSPSNHFEISSGAQMQMLVGVNRK